MNIILYTGFEKKRNSTKQPTQQTISITKTGTLKEPCSVLNPVFKLKRDPLDSVPDLYNYAYIPKFGRYYFVTNVTWNDGFWEYQLAVDVLASYAADIGDSSHYILRTNSSTTDFDPMITDTMYPASNDYSTQETVLTGSWAVSMSTGVYIVGIISSDDTNNPVGAVSYYAMTSTQFGALKDMLFSDTNLYKMGITDALGQMLVTDMSKEIFKTMYNPYQYIVSCTWFPFSITSFVHGNLETTLKIGWWEYNLENYPVFAQQLDFNGVEQTTIPAHPQAATRGAYLNYEPYTSIIVYGRFGTLVIDNSKVKAGWLLNFSYYVDAITGQCRVEITSWDDSLQSPTVVTLANRTFLLGVPIQLSQVGVDYMGAALATVDTAAGVMRGIRYADAGLALSSAAHGIYNTIQSKMPVMETSGANGSFLTPYKLTRVCCHFYKIVDEDISHKGRPLCQIRQIRNLSGYILCADGEFNISCLDEERTMISDFLTSGFFWE